MLFMIFKFAYQDWHSMGLDELKAQVVRGAITADQFKEISNVEYVEE